MNEKAGQLASSQDLIDVDQLIADYYDLHPDVSYVDQQVSFGTSGHRGTSSNVNFNEDHIIAISTAIAEYRKSANITGPLFLGRDTHALSLPAWQTAIEVLTALGVHVHIDANDDYTPTPAVSLAILGHENADGIVVTPSHNPPADGGFKYNPPHGGPADTDITEQIAARANELLRGGLARLSRLPLVEALASEYVHRYDFRGRYVDQLATVLDLEVIASARVRMAVDPLGGAAINYWPVIAEAYGLDLTVVNDKVSPRWEFMHLDWDGKIRMDCSSPYAMTGLISHLTSGAYDIAFGNDPDADRHGVAVPRPDGKSQLLDPNMYLAASINYLFGGARPHWPAGAAVGKTAVSSALIDRVAAGVGRQVREVPVGFKWFVEGLLNSSLGFGGEESAGASFLRRDGSSWTTDKDGLIMGLLAAEMLANTGKDPLALIEDITAEYGRSWYLRTEAPANRLERSQLAALRSDQVNQTTLAGEKILEVYHATADTGDELGGIKVISENSWFAARPSGTEDLYKIYVESFAGQEQLERVAAEAQNLVSRTLHTEK